jgi:hypothetical protein
MKPTLLFSNFIILGLIICFGCNKDSTNPDTNSDCQMSNSELICWTIIDDTTENPIEGAYGTLFYGSGFYDFVSFDSTNKGLACFCFLVGGVILDGFIRADGYEQRDLSGLTPSDISNLRLIPSP